MSNLLPNIGTAYTGIVTGAELERVSQEIFGNAQIKAPEQTAKTSETQVNQPTQTQQTSPSQIDLYSRHTDINLTQQVSQAKVDFNVQLSPQAIQNIEALKTLAVTQQMNVHKLSEGKIYVPVDNSPKSDVLDVFTVGHPTSIVKAFSMDKDKRGSNPFSYVNLSSQSKEEGADSNSAI